MRACAEAPGGSRPRTNCGIRSAKQRRLNQCVSAGETLDMVQSQIGDVAIPESHIHPTRTCAQRLPPDPISTRMTCSSQNLTIHGLGKRVDLTRALRTPHSRHDDCWTLRTNMRSNEKNSDASRRQRPSSRPLRRVILGALSNQLLVWLKGMSCVFHRRRMATEAEPKVDHSIFVEVVERGDLRL